MPPEEESVTEEQQANFSCRTPPTTPELSLLCLPTLLYNLALPLPLSLSLSVPFFGEATVPLASRICTSPFEVARASRGGRGGEETAMAVTVGGVESASPPRCDEEEEEEEEGTFTLIDVDNLYGSVPWLLDREESV